MSNLYGVFLLAALAAGAACSSGVVNAQNVNELSLESSGKFQPLDVGGGKCEEFVNDRGWEPGENQKANGDKFYIAVGTHAVQAPVGSRNYITSRENAFQAAFMKAKSELVQTIAMRISREIALDEGSPGTGGNDQSEAKPQGATKAQPTEKSTWNKVLKLVNAELDSELQKRGVDKKSPQAKQSEVKKAIENILNQGKFQDIFKTAAKTQLKGVRRIYVFEAGKKGSQAELCVVALTSKVTEQMADALLSGDPSLAPRGSKGAGPIKSLISKNLMNLLTSYGVEMQRDNTGQFWLVSYAQSGAVSNTKNSRNQALMIAKSRAQGNLRTFVSEQSSVVTFSKNAESWKEFEGNTGEYQFDNASRQKYKSESKSLKITGIKTLHRWGAKHPVTGQTVYGTVVGWSPSSSRAGSALGKRMNSTPERRGAASNSRNSQRFRNEKLNSRGNFSGGASGGSSQQDF